MLENFVKMALLNVYNFMHYKKSAEFKLKELKNWKEKEEVYERVSVKLYRDIPAIWDS